MYKLLLYKYIGSDIGPPTVLTDTDIGKKCHIGGQYFGRSDYRYSSSEYLGGVYKKMLGHT